jgi:Xaa-Pro aminopeptidase
LQLATSDHLAARHVRLRRALVESASDALIVTRRANLFYLSNLTGSAGVMVLTPDAIRLVLDFRYLTDARRLLASGAAPPGAVVVPVDGSYDETLLTVLAAAGCRAPAFEADDLSFARYQWLRARLDADVVLQPTRDLVERLRECKDDHEVAVLRRAARALSDLVPWVFGQVRVGRSEREIAAAVDDRMRSSGFSKPAFDTIIGSGPNGALPHATAGDRLIAPGDLVVADFGGVMDGYCVDLTRTVAVGQPSAEARRVHAAVLDAQRAAVAAVRPGVPASDVDRAARGVLERAGLGEVFGHGTGHGLGIEVHEGPRVSRARASGLAADSDGDRLVPGMVFTVEPGAYLPGWGGVRIEDDVLVTSDGCEELTEAPRDLLYV